MHAGHRCTLLALMALAMSACVSPSAIDNPGKVADTPQPIAAPTDTTPVGDILAIAKRQPLDVPSGICDTASKAPIAIPKSWSLWQRIRSGFALPFRANERVDAQLHWFASNPDYVDRVSKRAEPYLHYIVTQVEKRHLPSEIALLPIVESGFQPFAYSSGRAAGIWQFIPSTARLFDLKQNWWYDGRRDIIASTGAALDYLEKLNSEFGGDWLLTLAAYNSGAGTVMRAMRRNQRAGKPTDFWSLDLPAETQAYVPRLLALRALVENPAHYGIALEPIPDAPYFRTVDLNSQIDLAMAAKMAGISVEEVYRLNPGFNRWATAPNGPHRLVLPAENADQFEHALAMVPERERVTWRRHRIRDGETLSQIARHYRTSVGVLQRINHLRGHIIRAGRHLLIPVASRNLSSYALSAVQRLTRLQNAPRRGRKLVHTVSAGDTLWDISRAYRVSVRHLAHWNGMAPTDPLHPGQRLVIWQMRKRGASPSAPPGRLRSGRIQRVRYTVQSGDSLARISQRFRVRVADLRRWNDIKPGAYLQPGQQLTMYVDVTRQSDAI